jgi:hypothetical protein
MGARVIAASTGEKLALFFRHRQAEAALPNRSWHRCRIAADV